MAKQWTQLTLLEMARGFQVPSVVLAAAELDLVSALGEAPLTGEELAAALGTDRRATRVLADALVALELLEKRDGRYVPAPGVSGAFTAGGSESILPMLRHQANCHRSWARLASTVRTGRPGEVEASVNGAEADYADFIRAMEVASRHAAPKLIGALAPLSFNHLLDVGAGPATWTIAFLRAVPGARATIYDLSDALPISRHNVEAADLSDRVEFVAGDFYSDATLPGGADLAWVSAIVHQSSREENRELFAKVRAALVPGGEIMIRDMVMSEDHTRPVAGALFAVNMLARTTGGGTFSLEELREDLASAGFGEPSLTRGERDMDSVVRARRK